MWVPVWFEGLHLPSLDELEEPDDVHEDVNMNFNAHDTKDGESRDDDRIMIRMIERVIQTKINCVLFLFHISLWYLLKSIGQVYSSYFFIFYFHF